MKEFKVGDRVYLVVKGLGIAPGEIIKILKGGYVFQAQGAIGAVEVKKQNVFKTEYDAILHYEKQQKL